MPAWTTTLLIAVFLGFTPGALHAAYPTLLCSQSAAAWVLVKISPTRGIVPTSEDSWVESDPSSDLSLFSQAFALNRFLSSKSQFLSDGSMQLELVTENETLILTIQKNWRSGRYQIQSRSPGRPSVVGDLHCAESDLKPGAAAHLINRR